MEIFTALKASSGDITPSKTIRAAPTTEPAVRPTGKRGNAGKTANSHHITKAMHPFMNLSSGIHATAILNERVLK